jgi:hypothetical protein
VSDGSAPPYSAIEASKRETGVYVVSDGSAHRAAANGIRVQVELRSRSYCTCAENLLNKETCAAMRPPNSMASRGTVATCGRSHESWLLQEVDQY